MADHGRVGVIVPHGVLFRGGAEGKIRQRLIEENLLDAVIGLAGKPFLRNGHSGGGALVSEGPMRRRT